MLSTQQAQLSQGRRHFWLAWKDFRLILLGSITLLSLIVLSRWLAFLAPLRLVLGLIYVLFVPGYCLTAVLFPRNEDLDGIERIGLGLGLSIAWLPVLALILNLLPWGLQLWPIVIGELVSIALFSAIMFLERKSPSLGEAYIPRLAWQPRLWWRSLPPSDRRVYQFILMALTGMALALAWTFLVPRNDQFMTEFYILGPEGQAEGFPQKVAVGENIQVTLGLVNLERMAHTYRVEIWAVDPWTNGRRQLLKEEGPFELATRSHYKWPVTWEMPWPGDDQEVDLLLYDGKGIKPYRSLRLYLNVRP